MFIRNCIQSNLFLPEDTAWLRTQIQTPYTEKMARNAILGVKLKSWKSNYDELCCEGLIEKTVSELWPEMCLGLFRQIWVVECFQKYWENILVSRVLVASELGDVWFRSLHFIWLMESPLICGLDNPKFWLTHLIMLHILRNLSTRGLVILRLWCVQNKGDMSLEEKTKIIFLVVFPSAFPQLSSKVGYDVSR